MKHICFLLILFACTCCGQPGSVPAPVAEAHAEKKPASQPVIDESGKTILTRFNTPSGFHRIECNPGSFEFYLRNLPLKPAGSVVLLYDGNTKSNLVYDAVVDQDIGKKDLQQCADAVMRLRGEYFYSRGDYSKIVFRFTNGFRADFSEWIKGNRIRVTGNKATWQMTGTPGSSYPEFRKFMEVVFSYAGTLSLAKAMKTRAGQDLSIGDVFVMGGSPGHAVIVVDMAENETGEKLFMLAQGYMPAQEIHVLKNFGDDAISPWYRLDTSRTLGTPEWSFEWNQLKTFDE